MRPPAPVGGPTLGYLSAITLGFRAVYPRLEVAHAKNPEAISWLRGMVSVFTAPHFYNLALGLLKQE